MSRYDKLIKEATKPKPGAPKPKYIDPIIASSFSQDGSLQDMCKALSSRLTDSSSLVVMRSLIVIHTLIRNGGVDNVLSAMSAQGNLRLKNVVQGGNWQGYDAPRILSPYAAYLDDRIRAYRELRHDVIRAADAARTRGGDRSEGAESGLRLRRLTVEKGLLREVGVCQKVCSRLLDVFFAFFAGENTRDELALTAFRMGLKDLLAVYAAINEGVINVLEHYFEMSKVDATNALDTYKRFCTHTEKIVAFLSSARKISHHLNVSIPNLRHAPVSLAGALKEYLDDPNFEKNRQEYKENKRVADGKGSKPTPKKSETLPASSSKKSITIQEPSAEEKTKPVKPPTDNQALQDFFESIETDQMSMFGPNAQQQGFIMPQATGFGGPQMMAPQMMTPQMTGYNPFFGSSGFVGPQQTGFMQPQLTGFAQGGFLNPQMTGANPFRQSMMMQPTGAFGMQPGMMGMQQTGFPNQLSPFQQPQSSSAGPFTNSFGAATAATTENVPANGDATTTGGQKDNTPQRSASVPLPKALLPQKTGSRNPFAPPPGSTPPPVPESTSGKGPTLFELAYGGTGGTQGPTQGGGGNYGLGAGAWNGSNANGSVSLSPSLIPQKTGLIGNIASEFVGGGANVNATTNGMGNGTPTVQSPGAVTANGATSAFANAIGGQQQQPDGNSLSTGFSGLSFGAGSGSGGNIQTPTGGIGGLQAQPTGFGGSLVKPFVPESSFGQNLAAASSNPVPAIPSNMTGNPFANLGAATTTATTNNGISTQPTGFAGSSFFGNNNTAPNGVGTVNNGSLPAQQTTTSLGNGTLTNNNNTMNNGTFNGGLGSSFNAGGLNGNLSAQPTGLSGIKPFQPTSAFGAATFGTAQQPQQQQQQQQQQQTNTNPNVVTGSLF